MAGVKTRKQAARATSPSPSTEAPINGAADVSKTEPEPQENIFLFIPNVIGYSRIVLALASLYYMPLHPRTCSLLYSISCLLDAVDGYAARYFDQSTRYGAVLDMVTDRCTTACLLVFLSSAFPRWSLIFQSLISLDFASHYVHMYATLVMGGSEQSHKSVDRSRGWVLNLYYTNKRVLFMLCATNELCFIALYLLSFSSPTLSPSLLQFDTNSTTVSSAQPGSPAYTALSTLLAPHSAAALELARANKMDSTLPWILFFGSLPGMLIKQVINIVQLVAACQWIGQGDVEARRAARLARKQSQKRK